MKRLSILVVEGDENLARLFSEIFRFKGWDSDSFSDAASSIEAIESEKEYDVIITSYRVAGSNGVEIIKKIRSVKHRLPTPVLMLTGSGGGVEDDAYAAGANRVLQKPIDINRLVETVKSHVVEIPPDSDPPEE